LQTWSSTALNANQLVLHNDGKVGIGTASPGHQLDVESSAATTAIQITNTAADGDAFVHFLLPASDEWSVGIDDGLGDALVISDSNGLASPRMTILQSGNVGIGTTSPGNKLDITTGAATTSQFHLGELVDEGGYMASVDANHLEVAAGAEMTPDFVFTARSTTASKMLLNNGEVIFYTDDSLTDGNAFTPSARMTIDTDGNVGIGTTSPSGVSTGTNLHLNTEGDTFPNFRISRSNGSAKTDAKWDMFIGSAGELFIADSTGARTDPFIIEQGTPTNTLYLEDTGNVGIGTSSPDTQLDIEKNSSTGMRVLCTDTAGTAGIILAETATEFAVITKYGSTHANFADKLVIANFEGDIAFLPTSNVGIGVPDPHSKLEVNGAISSATAILSADTDAYDVSGINTLFVSTSAANRTIGGLSGGVTGQVLNVVKINSGNTLTLEHNEASGTQKILMHQATDETISANDYGGYTLVFNGTYWYDVSHARHV